MLTYQAIYDLVFLSRVSFGKRAGCLLTLTQLFTLTLPIWHDWRRSCTFWTSPIQLRHLCMVLVRKISFYKLSCEHGGRVIGCYQKPCTIFFQAPRLWLSSQTVILKQNHEEWNSAGENRTRTSSGTAVWLPKPEATWLKDQVPIFGSATVHPHYCIPKKREPVINDLTKSDIMSGIVSQISTILIECPEGFPWLQIPWRIIQNRIPLHSPL